MTPRKEKIWDYLILGARVLIAWTFFRYGWSKLTNNQFGLSSDQLMVPLGDLGLFKLSWYLFDQEPFKTFVGISQIITGILLIYNRTLILGAVLSIPILVNILIIDVTFIKMEGFYWRLSYYLLLDILILWHYKERVGLAFKTLINDVTTKYKHSFWAYLVLPLLAVGLELLGIIPKFLTGMIFNFSETINSLNKLPEMISEIFKELHL